MTEPQKGAAAVFLSYIWWGSMPLYWKLLERVPSLEILGHRVVWSAVFMALVLSAARGWREAFAFVRREPRASLWLAGGGFLITFNWWLYIWAVNSGQVLETSLGYYMNPLLSMLFGCLFFGERMRGAQKAALALAASGVAVQVAAHGSVPAAGAGLALSFALYGVLKKKIPADPSVSLSIETFAVAPLAFAWLAWLESAGAAAYPYDMRTNLLLAGAGAMTSSPLLLFAALRLRHAARPPRHHRLYTVRLADHDVRPRHIFVPRAYELGQARRLRPRVVRDSSLPGRRRARRAQGTRRRGEPQQYRYVHAHKSLQKIIDS